MSLVFDPLLHRYFLDGRELPGITRVLRDVGIGDLDETDPVIAYAAERGKAVHEATALDDRGELDEATVDPVVRPYLDAWRRFREQSGFRPEPELIEVPMACEALGFAGTPDRAGFLAGDAVVVEIKATSELHPRVGLQLAAQQMLLRREYEATTVDAHGVVTSRPVGRGLGVLRRFAVQLRPDGGYRLEEFKDPDDRNVFLAALRVFQWKQKEGA